MIRAYQKVFSNIRPVYDGKRNMYTRDPLPIGRERLELEVTLPGDSAVDRQFTVAIKWFSTVTYVWSLLVFCFVRSFLLLG